MRVDMFTAHFQSMLLLSSFPFTLSSTCSIIRLKQILPVVVTRAPIHVDVNLNWLDQPILVDSKPPNEPEPIVLGKRAQPHWLPQQS